MKKKVSVIIPTRNEAGYIAGTLESVLAQDYPSEFVEIIVADGESDDDTRKVVEELMVDHPNVKLIPNPERIVPYALNYAISAAKGELIVRMDSHSNYPKNYITRLVEEMDRLKSDNVGGVCITLPANEGLIPTGIALAISHPLGIGDSSFRIGSGKIKEVDTVPFGCFRRSLFDEIGLFDTDLIRNQDDEFNGRIVKNGGKIHLIPDVQIKYFARANLRSLSKMFYQYGLFKPLVNQKLGAPATSRQFVPPLFVLYLFSALSLPFLPMYLTLIWSLLLGLYFLLCFFVGFRLALSQKRPALVFILPLLFPIIHISYGWGYLKGFVMVFLLGKKPGSRNFAPSR